MVQAIGEILSQESGVMNLFAHLGAFGLVFHLLATRLLAVIVITSVLLVLNTLWPRAETTMSLSNQRPTH
jgi:hypothetical protein